MELLAKAKNPVIIAGGGCVISQAWDQVVEFAEMYRIPVVTTLMGKGTIPDAHPLSAGVMGGYTGGTYGRGRIANQIVAEADVAFIMGSRTDQYPYLNWTLPKKGTKIIHLDMDPDEIGRNFETRVAMVGDVQATLADVIDYCKKNKVKIETTGVEEKIKKLNQEWRKLNEPLANSEASPIRPERFLKELSDFVDSNTIIATDASYVSGWATFIDNLKKASTRFCRGRWPG
jgi:acetolactate synthase-1/2/3 large subunit